jgi:hypothetical protein
VDSLLFGEACFGGTSRIMIGLGWRSKEPQSF